MKRLLNLFLLLTMFVVNAMAVDYPIEVNGVTVTSSNASNILGDGTISFNASTNTLTLKNANYLKLNNKLTGTLTINAIGLNCTDLNKSSLKSDGGDIVLIGEGEIYTEEININNGDLIITGNIIIYARKMIDIHGGDLVVKSNSTLYVFTQPSYSIDLHGGNLSVLESAVLYAAGNRSVYETFHGIKGFSKGKDICIWPKGISFSSEKCSFVNKADNPDKRSIYIYNPSRYQKYMLSIDGTQLDEINARDLYDDLSVKYDDATKTLTLDRANLSGVCDVIHDYDYNETITINLIGKNTIKADYDALSSDGASYIITGDGTLNVSGINLDEGNLTVSGNAKVNVLKGSSSGINLREADFLSIQDNAELCVDGNGKDATLLGVKNLTLAEGFQIYPSNLSYSSAKQGIVDETGNFTKGNVKIYNANNYEKYALEIKGVQLNEFNASDVFGDGSVKYNDATKTLTLNNADLVRGSDVLYFRSNEKLIINLVGNSTIKANSTAIRGNDSDLTITGSGTLNVSGIDLTNCNLTIGSDAKVNVLKNGSYGINLHGGELIMQGKAELNVEGNGTSASITQVNNLTLAEGLAISPKNISYSSTVHGFVDENGNLSKGDIKICYDPSTVLYDLWIAGTQVNKANANDVFGDGTVKVEKGTGGMGEYYEITLKDANLISSSTAQKGMIYSTSNIYIRCIGTNSIEAQGDVNAAIYGEKAVVFLDSRSTLNVKGKWNGISAEFVDICNINLNVEGINSRGIRGFWGAQEGSLITRIDDNSTVKVKGGIEDFAEITLGYHNKMEADADICIYDFGSQFDHNFGIVTNDSQHNIYRDEIRFSCINSTTSISDIQSSGTTDAPAYDLTGRKVNGSYRGIVIKNGQKMMVK